MAKTPKTRAINPTEVLITRTQSINGASLILARTPRRRGLSLIKLLNKSRRFQFLDHAHIDETLGIGGGGFFFARGHFVEQGFDNFLGWVGAFGKGAAVSAVCAFQTF